MNRTVDKARAL